uniref:K Homology domain-containing protein n=1 Tax=Megaselia scalaris TaxID=36166 RepID=T1GSQ5_MEGSC
MLRAPTTPTLKLILGLGLCSLGGAMLYAYFKNKDDEDELEGSENDLVTQKPPREITIKMTVTNDCIPLVVGRNGANLKIIEDRTGARIRFRELDSNNQQCEIRGTEKGVADAKSMLMRDIQRSPIVKEEMYVPHSVYTKIIGRCGECLRDICRTSMAKVSVESGDRVESKHPRKIEISGTKAQVNLAKKLIEDKIKEDEEMQRTFNEIEAKREPRRSPTNSMTSLSSSQTSLASIYPQKEKLPFGDVGDKPMEVYVSAIASPSKFWLQIIGPQSRKLDELVTEMTSYYNEKENQEYHKIEDPYLDVVLDLYFVDYGDSEYVSPHDVYELRTDFLTLRFQAIECYLANVKPNLSTDVENWDQQAVSKFEELTQVASWKKLISRVVTYKARPKGGNHIRREGSPLPGVELYDPSEGVEVNIGHMLISHGFAEPDAPVNDVLRLGGGGGWRSPIELNGSNNNWHQFNGNEFTNRLKIL